VYFVTLLALFRRILGDAEVRIRRREAAPPDGVGAEP